MKVIPVKAAAGITGFESPAAEYKELGLSLDQLIVGDPNATFLGLASGDSMQGVGIFDGDLLIVDRAAEPKHQDVMRSLWIERMFWMRARKSEPVA